MGVDQLDLKGFFTSLCQGGKIKKKKKKSGNNWGRANIQRSGIWI